jgi:ABC-type molybdenum transport system ATPase subunit/photorepair protein PhrA
MSLPRVLLVDEPTSMLSLVDRAMHTADGRLKEIEVRHAAH